MSLLRDFKAERLIARLLDTRERSASAEERKQLVSKLRNLGDTGIHKLIQALGQAGREEAERISDLLAQLVDSQTLAVFIESLGDPNTLVVGRVSRVLAMSSGYDPNRLADGFANPAVSRAALLDVLGAHRKRLDARVLMRHTSTLEAAERNALYRLIGEVADESIIPDLLNRLSGKDPVVRQQMVRILARFRMPEVMEALRGRLDDPDRRVRQAVVEALSSNEEQLSLKDLCRLLRDRDMRVQEQAIEALVRRNDPATMSHLCPLLQDEADSVRRAAVEVLNGIGTPQVVKELLASIR